MLKSHRAVDQHSRHRVRTVSSHQSCIAGPSRYFLAVSPRVVPYARGSCSAPSIRDLAILKFDFDLFLGKQRSALSDRAVSGCFYMKLKSCLNMGLCLDLIRYLGPL